MKILQVISYFNPKFGGDVNVVFNHSKHLVKKGHEVTILTTDFDFDNKYAKAIRDEGVKVIPFHCMLNWGLFLYSPSMKSWVNKNIKFFDIVHMHNFRSYQNNVVHHYAKKNNVHYILQAHGSVLPFITKQRLKKVYDLVWGKKILNNATKLIALTKSEVKQYIQMGVGENRIEVLPNGINLSEYDSLPKRGCFRGKYDIKENEKIVLYVGRIHKSKGIKLLVEAFTDLTKQLNNVKLVFVGADDGYQQQLNQLINELGISDKILFTGFVDNQEKISAFIDSDVFVTPKFYGFPITFLEACMCGIPIVTTTDGDTLDWLNDKVGYITNYDKNHLQNTIFEILKNNELIRRFRIEQNKLVKEKFNWIEITGEFEKIYYQIKTGTL